METTKATAAETFGEQLAIENFPPNSSLGERKVRGEGKCALAAPFPQATLDHLRLRFR